MNSVLKHLKKTLQMNFDIKPHTVPCPHRYTMYPMQANISILVERQIICYTNKIIELPSPCGRNKVIEVADGDL